MQQADMNDLILRFFRDDIGGILITDENGAILYEDEKTAFICAAIAGAIYGYVDEWLNRGMDSVPPQISFRNMLSVIE